MGQYWLPVSLTKREFINPHKLGSGLKLWEQVANHPGTAAALVILLAAMPEARGGGDLDILPGNEKIVGRWAGDQVALIGDYAEDRDLPDSNIPASLIYNICRNSEDADEENEDFLQWLATHNLTKESQFRDISDLVAKQIEHELDGKFSGDGWRSFKPNRGEAA